MSKMMSSVLEKTMEQTISLLRGSSTLKNEQSVSLRNLHDSIISTNKSMHLKAFRSMVNKCTKTLKQKSQNLHLTLHEKRECLYMIMHLTNNHENLEFIFPFVIKFIEDSETLCDKHLGYTALVLLKSGEQSGVYLAVNTLLKNITNRNAAVACVSLTALASILDVDLIPVFLPTIENLILKSSSPAIKCKALIVLHAMVGQGPEFIVNIWDIAVKALCDTNPHVMSNSLPIIQTLLKSSVPAEEMKVHKKVVFILKQVEQGCLPIDMMYSGISGPWIQIRLISIIQKLPRDSFVESDLTTLEEIFTKMFARYQISNVLQFAIISESIRAILIFHPRFDKLMHLVKNTVEKALMSKNQNLFLAGTELLEIIIKILPGFSKKYSDILLSNLSGNSPSTQKIILRLIADITCKENSPDIVSMLVKKLQCLTNMNFIKDVLLSILKILTKFPMTEKWMLENYLPLLEVMKNEVSFSVLGKFLTCFQSVSAEAMQFEATRLCNSLNQKYTQLQYCMILEIICSCNENIEDQDCEKAIKHILRYCRELEKTPPRDLIMLSWNTVMLLSTQHNIKVDIDKISETAHFKSSAMVQQAFVEFSELLKCSLLVLPSSFSSTDFDEEMSFLDEYTKQNEVDVSSENNDSSTTKTEMAAQTKTVSKFKTNPYSKSRFDSSETPTESEVKPKKTFLDLKTATRKTGSVWNKDDYSFENPCNK